MNHDFEFVRNFLMAMEQKETDPATPLSKDQLGFTKIPDEIYRRQMIHLDRAGLIITIHQPIENIPQRFAGQLTEEGRQLLAKIRDEKVWQRIMSIQQGELATFSLAVLIALAERVTQMNKK